MSRGAIDWPGDMPAVIAFRDIARPTDVRTMISALVPFCGAGNTLPLILPDLPEKKAARAQQLDFATPDAALEKVVRFAGSLMTNVGENDILTRVGSLRRGTARAGASDVERAALAFIDTPTPANAASLISQISAAPGVRQYRTGVLRSAFRALGQCDGSAGNTFAETAVRVREQNRLVGRPLAKRSVGSTLLLKGLEAEVAVVLYADDMDARNLYVAMTRGAKRLVIPFPHQSDLAI